MSFKISILALAGSFLAAPWASAQPPDAGAPVTPETTPQADAGAPPATTEPAPPPPFSESAPSSPAETPPPPASIFNPTLTVFGDGLYRYDDRAVVDAEGNRVDSQFRLREVELDLRAAIDPFADGVVIVAFGQDQPDQFTPTVEEGYITIKRLPLPVFDEPPLGLKLKLGRFRTETGRINRLHLHDLPQPFRPFAVEEFLGPEGYVADGLSAQVFLPVPFDEDSALELIGQVLSGGGVPVAPGSPHSAAAVGNLRWFRTFAESHNLDLAFIFLYGRTDPEASLNAFTYSLDFLYKWRPLRGGEFRSFVLGAQGFLSQRRFRSSSVDDVAVVTENETKPLGGFAFAQLQVARSLYLGVRGDYTQLVNDDTQSRTGGSAYLTFYPSEFLRFRLGYEHEWSGALPSRNSAFAQVDFVIGAHPPEPFWMNK